MYTLEKIPWYTVEGWDWPAWWCWIKWQRNYPTATVL